MVKLRSAAIRTARSLAPAAPRCGQRRARSAGAASPWDFRRVRA